MIMSDPSNFKAAQLREFLRARRQPTTGAKAELVARLMESDPSGEWAMAQSGSDVSRDNVYDEGLVR